MSQSNDRLDQELATWFARRGVAWSGTATELLTSIRTGSDPGIVFWPESPRALYDHLRNHRELLRSLGVDVWLSQGSPRMVLIRSCPKDPALTESQLDKSEINCARNSPPSTHAPAVNQEEAPAIRPADAKSALRRTFPGENSATSDSAERAVNTKYALSIGSEARVFEDPGEALLAIGEMRRQIRERGFDLESAVNVAIEAALKITRCHRIVVGVLPPNSIGSQPGDSAKRQSPIDANLFRSRLMAGESVQLDDAQKDPILGLKCQREGIGALIIVPIFCDRVVAGSMEFLFHEGRTFSDGDVMDLGLIAAVVSESLGSVPIGEGQQWEGCEFASATAPVHESELTPELPLNQRVDLGDYRSNRVKAIPPLGPEKLAAATGPFWRALRRAWTGHPR
jgi:hypothetical protein